ncbi:MAG TPA: hypothetical protein VKU77_26540 [Streptosporangiaceae bacterium]|nr:hypothetical protein [Streptosporangiaceae bacterium]
MSTGEQEYTGPDGDTAAEEVRREPEAGSAAAEALCITEGSDWESIAARIGARLENRVSGYGEPETYLVIPADAGVPAAGGGWRELRASVSLPPDALDAAKALRYGEPVDTYTWDYVAEAVLLAATPVIIAAERCRIRDLAVSTGAVCTADEGTQHYFADLIRDTTEEGTDR